MLYFLKTFICTIIYDVQIKIQLRIIQYCNDQQTSSPLIICFSLCIPQYLLNIVFKQYKNRQRWARNSSYCRQNKYEILFCCSIGKLIKYNVNHIRLSSYYQKSSFDCKIMLRGLKIVKIRFCKIKLATTSNFLPCIGCYANCL